MKDPEDKEIFDLFGSRLADANNTDAYSDEDWERMEHLLDRKAETKTAIIWLYRTASCAAAILFMFIAFNIF